MNSDTILVHIPLVYHVSLARAVMDFFLWLKVDLSR